MKFGTTAIVALLALASFDSVLADANDRGVLGYFKEKFNGGEKQDTLAEDEAYWQRLMQVTVSSITPPPTPPPTPGKFFRTDEYHR